MKRRTILLPVLALILIFLLVGCEEGSRLALLLTPQPPGDTGSAQTPTPEEAPQDIPSQTETAEAPSTQSTLIALLDPQPLPSYDTLPRFVPTEGCFVDFTFFGHAPEDYDCGYVVVPADHNASGGNTFYLGIVRFPARAADPQPDPLFIAQGNPGESTIGLAPYLTKMAWFRQANAERDIVFFDQRGSRASAPFLPCDAYGEARQQALADGRLRDDGAALAAEALAVCAADANAAGWDLSTINSLQSAADVDAISQALGYEQINFYGASYGSMLGQHLLRDYPQILRSVTLDGVKPLDDNWGDYSAGRAQQTLDTLLAACAVDPSCAAQYRQLSPALASLYTQLEDEAAVVTAVNYKTLQTADLPLDGDMLAAILFDRLADPANYPDLLAALQTAVDSGDFTYFGRHLFEALDPPNVAMLAHFALVCAEDADLAQDGAGSSTISPLAAGYSAVYSDQYRTVCETLGLNQLRAPFDVAVISNQPTLLLSGQFDPLTPPSLVNDVLPGLGSAYSFTVPNGAHGQLLRGDTCVAGIFNQFLVDPQAEPDANCLQDLAMTFVADDQEPQQNEEPQAAIIEASACTAVPQGDVVVFDRPDVAADIFSASLPPEGVIVAARTLDGWLGFDPGVAQAANVGPFRLRWFEQDAAVTLTQGCAAADVPVIEHLPAQVCFTMAMSPQPVYGQPDAASEAVLTMGSGDYAAVIGRSDDGQWAQLDLTTGSLEGDGSGWLAASNLNLNGACP